MSNRSEDLGVLTVQEIFSFALKVPEADWKCYVLPLCLAVIPFLSFLAFRLTIYLAAQGLMGKRVDLQQQPHSLIEYGNHVTPHLHKSSLFVHLACSPICSCSLFLCASVDVSDSGGETAIG